MSGIIGVSPDMKSGVVGDHDHIITKTYWGNLSNGYTNSATISNNASSNLPATSDGTEIVSIGNVVLTGKEYVLGSASTNYGEWQQDQSFYMVCWAHDGSNYSFMRGCEGGAKSSQATLNFYKQLSAGTYTFNIRVGQGSSQTYGIWWGGRGVYGYDQWMDMGVNGLFTLQIINKNQGT